MSLRTVTGILILITFAVWLVWDVYAVIFGGVPATISAVITDFAYYSPAWPFIIGGLCGHWFFPAKKSDIS